MKYSFEVMEDVITHRRIPDTVPLYEHGIDDPIIEDIMGYDFSGIDYSAQEGHIEVWKMRIEFYRQMGYVYIPLEMGVKFAPVKRQSSIYSDLPDKARRGWVDERDGIITSMDDLERSDYWPDIEDAFDYDLFNKIADLVPEDMKIIGGASGGPFEHASFLTGLETLCIAIYEDQEFVERLFQKIGITLIGIAERLVKLDKVGIYRFGDDLGYKGSTMLSPDILRQYVFPWQRKVVEVVHKAGKPFLLHSCGQLEAIMDDLINDVKIDAKHSFEDVIMPVVEAKKRWGNRIAILGGIDVDFLCRSTPQEIKEHTKQILEICSEGGGYAAGSGNTIASYMPSDNYLAMVEAVREFNGESH